MKLLPKVLMIVSILMFVGTLAALIMLDSKVLIIVLLLLHSLSLIAFAYISITYKDPDTDSQRLSNLLQQSEAKYEEYKKDTDSVIMKKDEIISAMSRELEEYKKGIR